MKGLWKNLLLCGLVIVAPLGLAGCMGEENIDLRVSDGYIQWSSDDGSWDDLISVEDLLDSLGEDIKGEQGIQGVAGKQVEFKVSSTHIQWRYVGDSTWKDLISLEEIKGDKGADGKDGEDLTAEKVTVTFEYTLHKYFSDYEEKIVQAFREKYTNGSRYNNEIINKGDWLDLYNFSDTPIGDYFLGWYAGSGVDETRITSFTSICDNVTLTAKFDNEKIETEYYTEGLIFRLTQNEQILLSDTNMKYYDYSSNEKVYVVDGFDGYFNSFLGDDRSRKNLIFPREYNGVKVVGISSNFASNFTATYYDNQVEKTCGLPSVLLGDIYLPNTLEYIGAKAFYNLTDSSTAGDYALYIPNSIKYIGEDAFYGADYSISISNELSLKAVGDSAFYFSRGRFVDADGNVATISISENATFIGSYAFANVDTLVNIFVDICEESISDEIFQEHWYNSSNENISVSYKTA